MKNVGFNLLQPLVKCDYISSPCFWTLPNIFVPNPAPAALLSTHTIWPETQIGGAARTLWTRRTPPSITGLPDRQRCGASVALRNGCNVRGVRTDCTRLYLTRGQRFAPRSSPETCRTPSASDQITAQIPRSHFCVFIAAEWVSGTLETKMTAQFLLCISELKDKL